MRDLVDIGGHEADCGDNKPKADNALARQQLNAK